jgi:methylenetetrahydrofolate reductase (NADPH)
MLMLTLEQVHNDFHQTHGLFPLFNDLAVEDIEKDFVVEHLAIETNGAAAAKPNIANNALSNSEIGGH